MLKAIDKLLGNPITTKNRISLYGEAEAGKSTLALQIADAISKKTKRPALIYDTEGGIHDTLKSFGFGNNLHVWPEQDIKDIMYDHGTEMDIIFGGNITIRRKAIHDVSQMMQRCKFNKYSCIVYDSWSMPLKLFGGLENFNTRSQVHWMWDYEVKRIQRKLECVVILLHHSYKPIVEEKNKLPPDPIITGGQPVRYASKYIIHVERVDATDNRLLRAARHPQYAPFKYKSIVKLTGKGFVDV